MNVMEIRGLCKAYPAFTLKDVSFTVPQGAVMGFIGRNGAEAEFARTIFSISSETSGWSFRNCLALSRPWPRRISP